MRFSRIASSPHGSSIISSCPRCTLFSHSLIDFKKQMLGCSFFSSLNHGDSNHFCATVSVYHAKNKNKKVNQNNWLCGACLWSVVLKGRKSHEVRCLFLLLTWEWFTSRLQDGFLTDSFEWWTLFLGSSALLLFIYGPLRILALKSVIGALHHSGW